MKDTFLIEIKPKTIIITIVLIALTLLIIKLHTLVILVFIAFSISSTLSPIIEYFFKKGVPRNISVSAIYIIFFLVFSLLILLIYKPLINQIQELVQALPDILVNVVNSIVNNIPYISERFNWDEILSNIKDSLISSLQLPNISDQIISGVKDVFGLVGSFINIFFGTILNIVFVIVLSIYFASSKEPSKQKIIRNIPDRYQAQISKFFNSVESQLGSWMRAQFLLMFIIGFLSWVGFEIIGIKFSIPLGITAGLLEAIPGIGPVITIFIVTPIAYGSHLALWKIIFITIWLIIIQQLENYFIVPKLMQKAVGINPAITIIAILGASKIFNVWGALLAVPIVAIIQISLKHYLEFHKNSQNMKTK